MIDLNVNSLVSKVTSNIDDIGKIVGFAMGIQAEAKSMGRDFMPSVEVLLNELMRNPHFPNLSHVIGDLGHGVSSNSFKGAVKIALLGEILSYLKFGGKWANIMKKGGWNAALGVGIFSIVAHSAYWHSPAPNTRSSGGNSGGWGTN